MLQTFWAAVCVSALLGDLASSVQVPFNTNSFSAHLQAHDLGLFRPVESLTALSESSFTTLGHPLFPNYGVRIKQSRFCDESVRLVLFHHISVRACTNNFSWQVLHGIY